MGEIVGGKFSGPERVTIGDLLDAVEQDYIDRDLHSLAALRFRIKDLKLALGDIRAASLSTDQVKAYQRSRLKTGVTKTTVNREIEVLARAWHMGMQHGSA